MKDSKNLVIGMLCAVVCIMAVAYAAFSASLNVNGTAKVDANVSWDVHIKSANCGTPTKGTNGVSSLTTGGQTYTLGASVRGSNFQAGDTTVAFDYTLLQPGDSVTCTFIVENSGSMDAKLNTKTVTLSQGANDAVTLTLDGGIAESATLPHSSGSNTTTFTLTATYDSTVTSQPSGGLSNTAVINLGFIPAAA